VKARRDLLLWVAIVAAVLAACGSVNLGGLGGPGEGDAGAGAVDGGAGGSGGSAQGGGPPMQPTGGSPAPAAQGLVLQRARFVDGFDGSDWQCNAALCLRGRITP
jgi:hypothetical protein